MAKERLPIVGGLYCFYWPKRKPTMRAVGRVTEVNVGEEYTDVTIAMEGKPPHKIILDQARFEVAHPDELHGVFIHRPPSAHLAKPK